MVFSSGYVCDRERGDCVVLRQYRVGRRKEEFLLAMTSTAEHRVLLQRVDSMLFVEGGGFLRSGSMREFDRVVRRLTRMIECDMQEGGGFAMLLGLGDRACICNTGDHGIWIEWDRLGHRLRRKIGEMDTAISGRTYGRWGKDNRQSVMMMDVITIPEDIRLELGTRDRETAVWIDVK